VLIREAFLRGISTRQAGRVVATLTGEVVSAQTVSKLTAIWTRRCGSSIRRDWATTRRICFWTACACGCGVRDESRIGLGNRLNQCPAHGKTGGLDVCRIGEARIAVLR